MNTSTTARELLRRLAPVMGSKRMNHIWRAYLASDADGRRQLESALAVQANRLLNDDPSKPEPGLFPPPPPERCFGDLVDLGKVKYADKDLYLFGLRKEEMLRHVGVYGSSGSGKSNAIALLVDGLVAHQVPFLLIDFKRTYRSLLKEHGDLLVFTAGDDTVAPFPVNPLIPPPGTSIEVWAKKAVGALSHAYCQGAGSESLLLTALAEAYRSAASRGIWATFKDVANALDVVPARGRKGMWMDSAKRSVTSLTAGNAAQVFCNPQSVDIGALLNENVILEMDLLNQAEQTFLSEILLMWIIQFRMNLNDKREALAHAFIIEEAHHLLNAPPGMQTDEPVIQIALREVRELGESIIIATQNASVVPLAVFGNQATTLAFHTKHAADVRATAQAMLLKDEAKDELGRLPVGEAIVRVPRWADPVHISLTYRPIAKGMVTDADIREHMRYRAYFTNTAALGRPPPQANPIQSIPPSEDRQGNQPESTTTAIVPGTRTLTRIPKRTPPPTATPERNDGIENLFPHPSNLEQAMMRSVVKMPFLGVVERIKAVATSRRKGSAALAALEKRGLIAGETIYTGASLIKLFNLTQDGRAFCAQHGLGPLPHFTEGGITHRYWVHCAAEELRTKGWNVKTEYRVTEDLIVDVHAEKDGKVLAVLVETGGGDVKGNVEKAGKAGYTSISVLPTSPTARKIVEGLRTTHEHRMQVRLWEFNE